MARSDADVAELGNLVAEICQLGFGEALVVPPFLAYEAAKPVVFSGADREGRPVTLREAGLSPTCAADGLSYVVWRSEDARPSTAFHLASTRDGDLLGGGEFRVSTRVIGFGRHGGLVLGSVSARMVQAGVGEGMRCWACGGTG
jgi:hypothetical protein